MDYTTSLDHTMHAETGNRMHDDSGAVTTVHSARDDNMVIWSLMEVVKAGGREGIPFDPDVPESYTVLRDSIAAMAAAAVIGRVRYAPITALPTQDLGPVSVLGTGEIWEWVSTDHFTGYRSPLCGRPVDGHTLVPLAGEIDAVGGLLPKAAYPGLWAYAQENGLVVSQAVWTANIGAHNFVDVDANNFRVPDLRNMFRRYTGTDADTANVRALGSKQLDAVQNVSGQLGIIMASGTPTGPFGAADQGSTISFTGTASGNRQMLVDFNLARVARTSTETRDKNVAMYPRLHV